MSRQPFFPLFLGDLLTATTRWTGEERALYVLLLAYQWFDGPLPKEPASIALTVQYRLDRFLELWARVRTKYVETDEGLINLRLEEHRAKAQRISDGRSRSGFEGAAARWQGGSPTSGETSGKTRHARLAEARRKGTHSAEEWEALVAACEHRCVKCSTHKSELHGSALCKDHIIAIYVGGSDAIENIQPMCRQCNSSKAQDGTDYRPSDWRERMAKCMAKPLAPSHPIPSDTDQSDPKENSNTSANADSESVKRLELTDFERRERWQRCKSKFPAFSGKQDWISAEKAASQIVANGFATWDFIEQHVELYAAYCLATRIVGTQFVMRPGKYFSDENRPWAQDWTPPAVEVPQGDTRSQRELEKFLKGGSS